MKKAKEVAVHYQTSVTPQTATIQLDASLVAQLQQAADWKGISLEEAAHEAARDYFYQYSCEKVEKEQAVSERIRPSLLKKYRGQYVAVHNGEVVEHAPDLRALRSKVFAHYGHMPILHTQVTDEPERDIVVRSPRVERP